MGWLLRLWTLVLLGGSAVMLLIMWLGTQLPPSTGQYAIVYVEEDYLYHAHLLDLRSGFQLDLMGTPCDPGPPSWVTGRYLDVDPLVVQDDEGIYIVRYPPHGERCQLWGQEGPGPVLYQTGGA